MSRPACGQQRLSSRRLAAWLSLLALLLIYLGPLVAQTRALQALPAEQPVQAHHAGAAHTSEHAAEHGAAHTSAHTPEHLSAQSAGHAEHASEHLTEHASEHPPEHAAHHDADSLGDACGYCSLLLNSPALGNSAFMSGAAAFVDHLPRCAQLRRSPQARSVFPDARPRAPPAFF